MGKGGLVREVLLSKDMAQALEAKRLEEPRTIGDRKISYRIQYDLGGGNAWSHSFSSVSKNTLGWSTGGHGVRHTYVQERMRELQGSGYLYGIAKLVVSQELGHFRPDVINAYLR